MDGIIHDKSTLWFEEKRFSRGDGGVFETQIPPGPAAATNLSPSAEHAKVVQMAGGTLFDIQVDPPSLEV